MTSRGIGLQGGKRKVTFDLERARRQIWNSMLLEECNQIPITKYCDEYVCLFFYLFICLFVCPLTCQTSPVFVHFACGCGSALLWWHCDTWCTSGFVVDVIFTPLGQWARIMHDVVWKRCVRWRTSWSSKVLQYLLNFITMRCRGKSLLSTIALLTSVNRPIVIVHYFLQQVRIVVCKSVCVRAWVSDCTLKRKRLELSTQNLVYVYPVAVTRSALTQRSKSQRSRSHSYEDPHSCKTITDARLLAAMCWEQPAWAARRTTASVSTVHSVIRDVRPLGHVNLSRRHALYTCNAGGHEAGCVACNQGSGHHLREVRLTHRSHSVQRSQLHADCAETSDTAQHVRWYQHRSFLCTDTYAHKAEFKASYC